MIRRHRLLCAILLGAPFVALGAACSGSSTTAGTSTPSGTDAGTSTGTPIADAGSDASSAPPATDGGAGGTSLSGTLGTLGTVQPTVSSLMISNSGETLLYLSSAPLTCDQIKASRWLGSVTKGSQIVEIVIKGAPVVGDVAVPPGEVNYAQGGKSSSYEVGADSGKITFTKADAAAVEGTVTATYGGGGAVHGTFHADFCAGGQGY